MKQYDSDQPEAGLLYLCHCGCSSWEALVVSGPAKGQMWADDTGTDGGIQPLRDDGSNRWGSLDGIGGGWTARQPNCPYAPAGG
ncbi:MULTISPECIES: hypothetical protein [unclassified Pseudofrankia]|uniref:hypothetical protein n=1 Tax=unclassified Pseudofrankia TaxID=2994372 RepID=UPI001041E0D4|nr:MULTISPECIES: hypothetical protein [unclassified Pseudofrankia]MDT3439144.1 hypothetical protein [Pseudofrankia sp. BMG5.37]